MDEKLFTLNDLRAAFIAGELFESDTTSFNMGDIDAISKPDFGDWMDETFGINV